MPIISYIDAIQLAMKEEMERDERVFILGEDVGRKGGVFKATHGLYDQFGESRVLDTPLAESAIAGEVTELLLDNIDDIDVGEVFFDYDKAEGQLVFPSVEVELLDG